MPEHAFGLINTSRGGLVDEAAIVDALDRDLIAGVGFDVLTEEPPNPLNPLLKVLDRPWEVLDGPISDDIAAKLNDKGYVVLAWWDNGLRQIADCPS